MEERSGIKEWKIGVEKGVVKRSGKGSGKRKSKKWSQEGSWEWRIGRSGKRGVVKGNEKSSGTMKFDVRASQITARHPMLLSKQMGSSGVSCRV